MVKGNIIFLNGTSSSETFSANECSAISALPVFLESDLTSGMSSIIFSASLAIFDDSSSDIPGLAIRLIDNPPSLKGGKKELPKVKKSIIATANRNPEEAKTILLFFRLTDSVFLYTTMRFLSTHDPFAFLINLFSFPRK